MNYTYIYPENLQHHSESTRSAITPADNKPSTHSATTYRINIPMTNSSYTSFPGILAIRVNRARQKIPRTQYILAHCTQLVKDQPSPYIYIYMNTPSSPRTARVVCPSARADAAEVARFRAALVHANPAAKRQWETFARSRARARKRFPKAAMPFFERGWRVCVVVESCQRNGMGALTLWERRRDLFDVRLMPVDHQSAFDRTRTCARADAYGALCGDVARAANEENSMCARVNV